MKTTYKLVLSLGVIFALGLTSCLKDDMVESQKYGMINLNAKKIVEIPSGSKRSQTYSLPIQTAVQSVNTTVHLAAEEVAAEDVKVTLSLAESATMLAAYNTANSTTYTLLPSSLYALPNGLDVTIAKGTKDANFTLNLTTSSFDPSKTYALFVKIAAVDKAGYTISGNFNYKLLIIGVKNKYDGKYTLTGTMIDGNGTRVARYPKNVYLETVDGSTVIMFDIDADDYVWYYTNPTTGAAAWLGFVPMFTFNNATNKVIAAADGYGGAYGCILYLDSTYDSNFDPATKAITVKYRVNTRLTITETYTYVGVR
jgi:hypothetical protein